MLSKADYFKFSDTVDYPIVDYLIAHKTFAVGALGEEHFKEHLWIPQPHLVESYILPEKNG